ncbi:hypothetical protein R3W88_012298 [Solanum pinnatisectum]|uniref:Ulp1 protease family, C-terminal catalytic domain containing protein n=1 Tax=Solanum pinnatisectum TaxID=50273 RepID=A0AAV9L8H3_9SOLN|nr:hypothetical protein R3W88_012298 [Solanum pinnatisectum]
MNFSIHDQDIGRSVVHVEEQEQVTEINVAKRDDTSFKEQVMEDAIEVIPTTHHSHVSIEETVLNKKAKKHSSNPVLVDTSDYTTSASISSGTEAVVDALIRALPNQPITVKPLSSISPLELTGSADLLTDRQLPTQLPVKKSPHNLDTKTPAPRNRMPSKIMQSPYLTSFESSDKGKAKIDDDIRPLHPFERCGILYQMSSGLMYEFSQWIEKGLLKSHVNKAKSALFGFDHMDFVVAFPLDKN